MLPPEGKGPAGYLPDFLAPKPTAGRPAEILRDQIDAVAETPIEIVAANLASAAAGADLPRPVRRAVDDGTVTIDGVRGKEHLEDFLHHFR